MQIVTVFFILFLFIISFLLVGLVCNNLILEAADKYGSFFYTASDEDWMYITFREVYATIGTTDILVSCPLKSLCYFPSFHSLFARSAIC